MAHTVRVTVVVVIVVVVVVVVVRTHNDIGSGSVDIAIRSTPALSIQQPETLGASWASGAFSLDELQQPEER